MDALHRSLLRARRVLHFAERHETKRKACSDTNCFFRTVPATPAANKWTKLAPVCDLLILGLLVHGVFVKTFAALGVAHDENALRLDSNLDFDMIKEVFFFCRRWQPL